MVRQSSRKLFLIDCLFHPPPTRTSYIAPILIGTEGMLPYMTQYQIQQTKALDIVHLPPSPV